MQTESKIADVKNILDPNIHSCTGAADVQNIIYYHLRLETPDKDCPKHCVTDENFAKGNQRWPGNASDPPIYYRVFARGKSPVAIFSGAHDYGVDNISTTRNPGCTLRRLLLNYRVSRKQRKESPQGQGLESELIIPLSRVRSDANHWVVLHLKFVRNTSDQISAINATLYDPKGEIMRYRSNDHIEAEIRKAFPARKISFNVVYLGNQTILNNYDCGRWVALYTARLAETGAIGDPNRLNFHHLDLERWWSLTSLIKQLWFRVLVLAILIGVMLLAAFFTGGTAVPFFILIASQFGMPATLMAATAVGMGIFFTPILLCDLFYTVLMRLVGFVCSFFPSGSSAAGEGLVEDYGNVEVRQLCDTKPNASAPRLSLDQSASAQPSVTETEDEDGFTDVSVAPASRADSESVSISGAPSSTLFSPSSTSCSSTAACSAAVSRSGSSVAATSGVLHDEFNVELQEDESRCSCFGCG